MLGTLTLTVVLGTLPVDGGTGPPTGNLDRDIIVGIIRRHSAEVWPCFAQALANKSPQHGGKVVVSWVIAPDGQVSEATVSEDSLGLAPLEACIAARVKAWRFPPPEGHGPVHVSFPFVYSQP